MTAHDDGPMFTLEIRATGAAFADVPAGIELARILRRLADKLETDPTGPAEHVTFHGAVADVNGNGCGTWEWSA